MDYSQMENGCGHWSYNKKCKQYDCSLYGPQCPEGRCKPELTEEDKEERERLYRRKGSLGTGLGSSIYRL